MARTGQGGIIGIANEVTYGTRVAPVSFFPWLSESMKNNKERMTSEAVIPNELTLNQDQRNGGNISATGDLQLQVNHAGQELLFEHMLGTVAVDDADDPIFTRTFTPGDLDAKSFSLHIARPDVGGTTRPFDYVGCKIPSWSIGCQVGEFATLAVTIVGKAEETNHTTATPSFIEGSKRPYKYIYGTATTIGGAAVKVKAATITGDNKLSTDRRFLGQPTISAPLGIDRREYAGSLTLEFDSLTQYNHFLADDWVELVLGFANGDDSFTITEQIQFDGDTPNMSGRGVIDQVLPFIAAESDSKPAISIDMVNSTAD